MGLHTTHDCWTGGYGAFNDWRTAICAAAGWGDLSAFYGFGGTAKFPVDDVLTTLLEHDDCDGDLKWQICGALADRLEALVPTLPAKMRAETQQFIKGLRCAHDSEENVEFH